MKKLCLTLAILSSFLFANSNDLYVILDDKLLKPMAEFQNSGDKNKAEEFYQNLISEISKIPSARDKRFVANEFFDLLRSEKKLHNIKINLGELILKGLTPASLDDENLLIEMHKIADEHYESFDIKNKKEKQEALIRRAQIEEQLIKKH